MRQSCSESWEDPYLTSLNFCRRFGRTSSWLIIPKQFYPKFFLIVSEFVRNEIIELCLQKLKGEMIKILFWSSEFKGSNGIFIYAHHCWKWVLLLCPDQVDLSPSFLTNNYSFLWSDSMLTSECTNPKHGEDCKIIVFTGNLSFCPNVVITLACNWGTVN